VDAVGKDVPIPVDVRIITATNRDLGQRIREGTFREDLFYRLNVVEIGVSPLRERREDIPLLVGHFVTELAEGRELVIPPRVMVELASRPWPGNVRELKNACERMVILCRGNEISPEDLPGGTGPPVPEKASAGIDIESWPPLPPEGLSLVDLEKKVIECALKMKKGNITRAAACLRIPRHILVYRLEKYGFRREIGQQSPPTPAEYSL
jgi:two-component system NtrC family response regulator